MKLASIIVLYYPGEYLEKNIKSFIDYVDLLLIWHNTPKGDQKSIDLHEYADKVVYLGTGKNEGLGIAYNEGVKYLNDKDYTHIMTMDQDSFFINFQNYRYNVEQERDKTVGIMAPPVNNREISKWEPFDLKNVIQSGSIFSIKMLKEIGLFRSDFFIDQIDVEISYRARINGYKCICYCGCNLIQPMGSQRVAYFGKSQVSISDYPALRRFYFTRNSIFLMKQYNNEYSMTDKINFILYEIKSVLKIVLYENDKIDKISALIKGFYFGLLSINKPYK